MLTQILSIFINRKKDKTMTEPTLTTTDATAQASVTIAPDATGTTDQPSVLDRFLAAWKAFEDAEETSRLAELAKLEAAKVVAEIKAEFGEFKSDAEALFEKVEALVTGDSSNSSSSDSSSGTSDASGSTADASAASGDGATGSADATIGTNGTTPAAAA